MNIFSRLQVPKELPKPMQWAADGVGLAWQQKAASRYTIPLRSILEGMRNRAK
jgi:hypothetical protein